MSASLVIPGVETFHSRQAWEPGWDNGVPLYGLGTFRMATDFHRTPGRLILPDVDRAAIHYTSAINLPDGDPGEILTGIDGIRSLLARTTVDYYRNRTDGGYRRLSDDKWFEGFPFGYSFAVDWLGGVWEGRGWDYVPAATGGHNGHTIAILMLTDRADPGSELMWASARAIQREAVRRGAPLENRPWAHGWFRERTGTGTATACCGAALKAQIDAGYGDLDFDNPEETMKPTIALPDPERAYDSRPAFQADVTPALAQVNKDVPLGTFRADESRKVFVGMCNAAELNITVVGTKPGWVKVAGTDTAPRATAIQTDRDGVTSNCVPVGLPDGHVRIWTQHEADIVVDVFARG